MKFRTPTLAALSLLTLAAAAHAAPARPNRAERSSVEPARGGAVQALPRPDLKAWASDQYVFIVNYGDADYTGAVKLVVQCSASTSRDRAHPCGDNFSRTGKFTEVLPSFPAGHGNAPIKGSGNAQIVSGAGWRAVHLGLPPGTYELAVTVDPDDTVAEKSEANNTDTRTVVIPGAQAGPQVGPVDAVVTPKVRP